MNALWLFVVWNKGKTWTRANVPAGVASVNDLMNHVKRGQVESDWIVLLEGVRYSARLVGKFTVLAVPADSL